MKNHRTRPCFSCHLKLFLATWSGLAATTVSGAPTLIDEQFELPDGFHIYRAATADLTGGSYDITFDGSGRLLVADGQAVRRLQDQDGDGIFDSYQTIAEGPALKGRGPQGLLVYGDHLYAVAGDGVQLFSGYTRQDVQLTHERRLGQPFHTGGDHAAHTVLRGLDGYVYLVTGDGAGTGGRTHITEKSSPVLEERGASVFRFDPTGRQWECVGSGGRNPPSLGMNYLGELFSFDSDMEFHVDVPFYRPVRLNHWATGGDQGWQSVGAFPSYYVDCLPGILEVGRGSPNWGVVYEHHQLPSRYHDAFIVCDYRWKSATSGRYATSGRLLAFHLQREAATWKSALTELARAKPGAKDARGNPINFALVDIDVAPDGSLFASDHNQGIWRIFYDPDDNPTVPPIAPTWPPQAESQRQLRAALLTLPQPAAEWSRTRQEVLLRGLGSHASKFLRNTALDSTFPLRQRLRAIRLLSHHFQTLPTQFIARLSRQAEPDIRAQAAWLAGIRGEDKEQAILIRLLDDVDPFARRRAAEALSRSAPSRAISPLLERLRDPDRHVRYAAMTSLSHYPTEQCISLAGDPPNPQVVLRLLVAAHLRKERPPSEWSIRGITRLLNLDMPSDEHTLDLLRVLSLYRLEINHAPACKKLVATHLLTRFPHDHRNIRWEQVRLLGQFKINEAFPRLVNALLDEQDHVTQFHIAAAIAEIPAPDDGYDASQRNRLAQWLISTQQGWFAEFGGKGLQFPSFWATTLNNLTTHHADELVGRIGQIDPASQLAKALFSNVTSLPDADSVVIDFYKRNQGTGARKTIANLFRPIHSDKAAKFLVQALNEAHDPDLRKTILLTLASNPGSREHPDVFLKALFEFEDDELIDVCTQTLIANGSPLSQLASTPSLSIAGYTSEKAVYFRMLELMTRLPKQVSSLDQALTTLTGQLWSQPNLGPRVIWSSTDQREGDTAWFAKRFEVAPNVIKADMVITCDNEFSAFLNGIPAGSSENWDTPLRIDILQFLRNGNNLIAVEGRNSGGPAGLMASLSWTTDSGTSDRLVTNSTWSVRTTEPPAWPRPGKSSGTWHPSIDVSGPSRNVIEAYNACTLNGGSHEAFAIQEYWHKRYRDKYREAFVARPVDTAAQRNNLDVHRVLADMHVIQGDVRNGRALYLKAGCYACHGGIEDRETSVFGPDLGGVTLRLKRQELADAIVFPSKQVEQRFKASVLLTTDGKLLNGFITERSDDFFSITDLENNVTRVPRGDTVKIEAQDISLMPEGLLNRFTDEEIRNLIAFLASLK